MKKKFAVMMMILVLMLTACAQSDVQENSQTTKGNTATVKNDKNETTEADKSAETEEEQESLKVALITSSGGLGDRSFNDAANLGFKKAEEELGVEIKVIEPQSSADYLQSLKLIAAADYEMIMVVGNDWGDALDAVMPSYPEKKFVGVNINNEASNLAVARFADHEGSFIVGALAAMMSESGKIGFVGGMDIPGIVRFYVGYEEGAKYARPDIEVIPTYVGSFADPLKGKEFSLQLVDAGADIIYHAAGKTGEGLFEAVKDLDGVYAIGVDQDQDYIAEGKVLTSMVKRVDLAAYNYILQCIEDRFAVGTTVYDLALGGVDTSAMLYTKDMIPEEVLEELEQIKRDVVEGNVVVTDVFNQ